MANNCTHILIVAADVAWGVGLTAQLTAALGNCQVDVATSAAEAYAKLAAQPCDWVVSGGTVPNWGVLARRIKDTYPQTRLLLMTQAQDAPQGFNVGVVV